ncbi:FEKKY domain-containing protein [Chryseobacterium sp. VD8]|uniref:FEKKY domain-containing protein n=1 Tax=Chryseobacterium sp. VD8 TaxID=3081254 RepID=UPI00301B0AE3
MISKKLLRIAIAVLFLLIVVHTLGNYLILYPMKFDFWTVISESQPQYLLFIIAFFVLISWLISHVRIKNLSPKNRFLLAFTILCGIILLWISYFNLNTYFNTRKVITKIENDYIQQAKEDIKNDQVTFRFTGGFELPNNGRKMDVKIDSIQKKYGIKSENTGCTIDEIDTKAQEKYIETVKPYLEKRNGKGWESKMQNEINKLKLTELSTQK